MMMQKVNQNLKETTSDQKQKMINWGVYKA